MIAHYVLPTTILVKVFSGFRTVLGSQEVLGGRERKIVWPIKSKQNSITTEPYTSNAYFIVTRLTGGPQGNHRTRGWKKLDLMTTQTQNLDMMM